MAVQHSATTTSSTPATIVLRTTTTTISRVAAPIVRTATDVGAYRIGLVAIFIAIMSVVAFGARTPRVRRNLFAGGVFGLTLIGWIFALTFDRIRQDFWLAVLIAIVLWGGGYALAALDRYWPPFDHRMDVELVENFPAPGGGTSFAALAILVRNHEEPRSIAASVDWLDDIGDLIHIDDSWNPCWIRHDQPSAPFDTGQGRGLILLLVRQQPGLEGGNDPLLEPVLVQQLDVPLGTGHIRTGSHKKSRSDKHNLRVTLSFNDGTPPYRSGFRLMWEGDNASLRRDDSLLPKNEQPKLPKPPKSPKLPPRKNDGKS